MSADVCPKCLKTLPASTLRAQAWGTTCPFCAAFLKRPSKPGAPVEDDGYASFEVSKSPAPSPINPTAVAAPKADDGYASFEVGAAAPPPAKPTLAASAKAMRTTIVGTAAIAPRDRPFEGTPAPIAFALSPPANAPPARAPAASARAAAAPARASVAPSMAPRPAAPGLTPPAPAPAPPPRGPGTVSPLIRPTDAQATAASPGARRGEGIVRPLVADNDSEPTHVARPSASASAAPGPLVIDSDSGPTNVMPSKTPEPAVMAPLLFPDSEPIASVSMQPDPESPAPPPPPVFLEPARPWARNAIVFGATALATLVVVLGVKVIRGPKPRPPVATTEAAKPTPEAEPPAVPVVEPLQPKPAPAAEPAPAAKPALKAPLVDPQPAARPSRPAAVALKPAPAREAPAPRAEIKRTAPAKAAPIAHKRAAAKVKVKGKVARGQKARVRKLALRQPAAKQSAPTPPPERADPRATYERGNGLLFAGDGKGAIAAYREAVRSAPNDPIGFRGLGLAYEHEGETALAIRSLRRYLKLAPDAPDRAIIARRIDRLSHRVKSK